MTQNASVLVIGLMLGALIGLLISKLWHMGSRSRDRKNSVQQSKATTLGYVHEKVAPLMPSFPYHYKDLVFLGKWVDYLCFDGLSTGHVKQVVFIEIKSGGSTLNKNERLIRDAIEAGRVKWDTMRVQQHRTAQVTTKDL
jgi:predicted Holliday junction resolvase-like endonuclease